MDKKIVIGMTALAIGTAVAGGVVGATCFPYNGNNGPNNNGSQIQVDKNYAVYELPEVFKYSNFSEYEINDDFSIFSSGFGQSYVLDKKSGEFKFLMNSSVRDVFNLEDKIIVSTDSGHIKLVYLTDFEVKDISLSVILSNVRFSRASSGVVITGYDMDSNDYKLVKLDENFKQEFNISVSYELTSREGSLLEFDNHYIFTLVSPFFDNNYMCLIDKETFETKQFSRTIKEYTLKENKLYFLDGQSGSLNCLDFESKELSLIGDVGSSSNNNLFVYESGILIVNDYSLEETEFFDFSSNELVYLGEKNVLITSVGPVYYGIFNNEDGSNYYALMTFDSENKSFVEEYKFRDSESLSINVVKYGNREIIQRYRGTSEFVESIEISSTEEGKISFNKLKVTSYLPTDNEWEKYEITKGKYFYSVGNRVGFYDSIKDEHVELGINFELVDWKYKDNVLTYTLSNGIVKEFDLKLGTILTVGYAVEK